MAVEVAAKANIFRRAGTRFVDYVKTLGGDYAAVSRGVFDESKARPIKAVIVTTALGGMGYALKTNPTELQLKDRLCILRQNLALLPLAIHSSRADNKLAELTHLISSGRLEYYDCWFFSLLVDRAWDKHVRSAASQDKNLKEWFWQRITQHIIDVGAFNRFFELEKSFINYDVREQEFS